MVHRHQHIFHMLTFLCRRSVHGGGKLITCCVGDCRSNTHTTEMAAAAAKKTAASTNGSSGVGMNGAGTGGGGSVGTGGGGGRTVMGASTRGKPQAGVKEPWRRADATTLERTRQHERIKKKVQPDMSFDLDRGMLRVSYDVWWSVVD